MLEITLSSKFRLLWGVVAILVLYTLWLCAVTFDVDWQRDYYEAAAERRAVQSARETLDLAIEFGYDPLIVMVVRQEASIVFHQRQCSKCQTWRFVKTDKELTYLLLSIIQVESSGNFSALNAGGPAYGLTQLLLSTARQYDRSVTPQQLLTIPKNLHIAVTHFVDLLERFHGNYTLAVISWNRGSGAVERSIALGESPENGYAKQVFESSLLQNAKTR